MDNQPPPAQPVQSSPPAIAKQSMFPVIMAIVVLIGGSLAGLGGGLALKSYLHKRNYQATVQDFITAIQKNDKAKADSLESPAAKAFFQKNAGTPSFYDACQQEGLLCTATFKASYLSKAVVTHKDYTSSANIKGKETVYTIKQSLGAAGCGSSSTNTLTIAVVPQGSAWLVDNVDENVNASGNFCLNTGGGSSSGN